MITIDLSKYDYRIIVILQLRLVSLHIMYNQYSLVMIPLYMLIVQGKHEPHGICTNHYIVFIDYVITLMRRVLTMTLNLYQYLANYTCTSSQLYLALFNRETQQIVQCVKLLYRCYYTQYSLYITLNLVHIQAMVIIVSLTQQVTHVN